MSYKIASDKHKEIALNYLGGESTTEAIAKKYGVTPRAIQRIVKKLGVVRTPAQSNKVVAHLKKYKRVPEEMRVKRKHLSRKQRYSVLLNHPYCTICGMGASDAVRLEVDHKDNDATNNHPDNLQVLCASCNIGKSHLARFGT